MNYLITGGTGFIGKALIKKIQEDATSITVLSRNVSKVPSNCTAVLHLSEIADDSKIDVIINLAGEPIDKRWSDSVKAELLDSRINTTKSLIALINRLFDKPSVMINASAIGYYGPNNNIQLDEYSSPAESFAYKLCHDWEKAAKSVINQGVRLCIARFGVVLGADGGVIKKILPPFKLGLGGKLGSGKQMFSWIHMDDVIAAIQHLITNAKCSGAYNLTAPNPITNSEFTIAIGKILNKKTNFTIPGFMLKILFGEMGEELLLGGKNVIPKKLLKENFEFQSPTIDKALNKILN